MRGRDQALGANVLERCGHVGGEKQEPVDKCRSCCSVPSNVHRT